MDPKRGPVQIHAGEGRVLQLPVECEGEQVDQGAGLHGIGGRDFFRDAVEGPGREALLASDEFGDARVNGVRGDDPLRGDGLVLADAVHPVDGLRLFRRGPAQLGQHDVGGGLQVDADSGGR